MKRKLTQEEASKVLVIAKKQCSETSCRLGQAIWNLVDNRFPNLITLEDVETHDHTENDFFYWENEIRVVECFYSHYVDLEDSTNC